MPEQNHMTTGLKRKFTSIQVNRWFGNSKTILPLGNANIEKFFKNATDCNKFFKTCLSK